MAGQTNADSKSSGENRRQARDQTSGKVTARYLAGSETEVRAKSRACEFCVLLSLKLAVLGILAS